MCSLPLFFGYFFAHVLPFILIFMFNVERDRIFSLSFFWLWCFLIDCKQYEQFNQFKLKETWRLNDGPSFRKHKNQYKKRHPRAKSWRLCRNRLHNGIFNLFIEQWTQPTEGRFYEKDVQNQNWCVKWPEFADYAFFIKLYIIATKNLIFRVAQKQHIHVNQYRNTNVNDRIKTKI